MSFRVLLLRKQRKKYLKLLMIRLVKKLWKMYFVQLKHVKNLVEF